MASKYIQHKEQWNGCIECELCERRKNVVLCRGELPANILFIGEAPGPAEDVIGQPFVGPAGQLLDSMIVEAKMELDDLHNYLSCAFTNLVACIPKGEDGKKFAEPDKSSIESCAPRLDEIYRIANPYNVVCVGRLAEKWVPKLINREQVTICSIIHPAAILRMDASQKGLAIQRTTIAIRDVFLDYF